MNLWRPIPDQTACMAETATMIQREHRTPDWNDAWQQHLEWFESQDCDLDALTPAFVGRSHIHRFQGRYIESFAPDFELLFIEHFREWLFRTHLSDISHLYEFGSGSGLNVAAYAGQYPDLPITALDWAPAAVKIADLLHEKHGMKIEGRPFDFFEPDWSLSLQPDSGVLTMCALEQTGTRFEPFMAYLLAQKIKRAVHVEPIVELYDSASPFDGLAIDYHRKRGYLTGLLPCLLDLQRDGEIKITYQRRLGFGSRFHEGYSVIAWQPT